MVILEKETQPDSHCLQGHRQVVIAATRLPIFTEEVILPGFIACGGCPHPEVCYFKGGCEQGNPTG